MELRKKYQTTIDWLLEGDPSIRWQTLRDLCESPQKEIKKERLKIESEGWGKQLLDHQDDAGTWDQGLYNPKWTSTTYTLLLLRRLGINPQNVKCKRGAQILLDNGLMSDGGINYSRTKITHSETCITGLVFGILSYFQITDKRMDTIFDYLVKNQMEDGGWNCRYPLKGATHASFHTTLMVLEALYEYQNSFSQKISEIEKMQTRAHEFLLQHELYKSHRTRKTVSAKMTMLSFPPRWYYTVIAALDYFQKITHERDKRFTDAIKLITKREKDAKWPLQAPIRGKIWFTMESSRQASRWNTLRALRILQWWVKQV